MKTLLTILSALTIMTDTTIYSTLPAQSHRKEFVAINEGKTSIEVYTDADKNEISCSFIHAGQVVMSQSHTHHCYGITPDLVLPARVEVDITNHENHSIHYIVRAKSVQ